MKIRSWQWVIVRKPERSVLGPPGHSPITGAVVVSTDMPPMSALPIADIRKLMSASLPKMSAYPSRADLIEGSDFRPHLTHKRHWLPARRKGIAAQRPPIPELHQVRCYAPRIRRRAGIAERQSVIAKQQDVADRGATGRKAVCYL